MSTALLHDRVDREVHDLVTRLVQNRGIPGSVDAGVALAQELYPEVRRQQRRVYQEAVQEMLRAFPAVEVAPMRPYPLPALTKTVLREAGHRKESKPVLVELWSAELQDWQVQRLLPYQLAGDPKMLDAFVTRLGGYTTLHAMGSGRDAIWDTAAANSDRGYSYARIPEAGACEFCLLLASQSGHYHSAESAVRTASGSLFHPNCRCVASLVHQDVPWLGKDDSDYLYDLWTSSSGEKDFAARVRLLRKAGQLAF